jgi:hypothetical protein
MFARPAPGLGLLPFAAACLLAAACSDVSGPTDPAARPSDVRRLTATEPLTCSPADSIQAGYGCCSTGGIEYTEFEYDPATGTEYVPTCDKTGVEKGLTPTTSEPLPPPPTSPTPTSPTPTPTSPTPTR